ncbi:putative DNA-binding transcriptional regulator YafY [Paenibacillus turicensis]|uniref:DNA-binding transcriptional regulator YafY n=1 Tax=Paenibacillus turicensis TaxID=160487 RepID=A0ABS4FTI4_9BACL|nr:YafY family protein [Paenibacillus turicensis]MBP1905877.1 putative DNA-binding transcriptional regulator YafY [Paenibacillus turicensis]
MKIERLLSIIITLLNRKRVQAKELADSYGVSIRTIYRDIDTISLAGIPIVTYQGTGGGIGLIEGYHLEQGLLSEEEMKDIVIGLQSISTVLDENRTSQLLQRFRRLNRNGEQASFVIDYSGWKEDTKESDARNFIKSVMDNSYMLSFQYCNVDGVKSERVVEPHTLVLKGQRWYLYAYCSDRQAFRLFKLSRMEQISKIEQHFEPRDISKEVLPWKPEFIQPKESVPPILLQFNKRAKHIAEEWFGHEALQLQSDTGTYLVHVPYHENDWLYRFILGLGADVVVVEPLHLRYKIRELALEIAGHYL